MKFDLATLKLSEGTYSVGVKAKNGSHSESLLSTSILYKVAPAQGAIILKTRNYVNYSFSNYRIKLNSSPTNLATDYDYYTKYTSGNVAATIYGRNNNVIAAGTSISLPVGTIFYAWADYIGNEYNTYGDVAYYYKNSSEDYSNRKELTTSAEMFKIEKGDSYTFYPFAMAICLTGDTLITMNDCTERRIDTIEVGDKILSYNPETGELEEDEVTYSDSTENKQHNNFDVWTFDDGTVIKTVHRHRFYNVERNAMIYMDEWQIGEHSRRKDGAIVKLISHENIKETINHFTIFTHNQNYFANGLLSGNRYTKHINF